MMGFPAQLKAVVFDLDGTLLDTAPEFIEVVQALRAEHGLPPMDHNAIRAVVSDGARAMVSLALDLPQDHPDFEDRRQRFLEIYAQDIGRATRPYPGIETLVRDLESAGIRWGISTNKPSYLTEPLLQRLGMQPPPASVVCPDHVSQPKPHPEPLLLNCSQLECNPDEILCAPKVCNRTCETSEDCGETGYEPRCPQYHLCSAGLCYPAFCTGDL